MLGCPLYYRGMHADVCLSFPLPSSLLCHVAVWLPCLGAQPDADL